MVELNDVQEEFKYFEQEEVDTSRNNEVDAHAPLPAAEAKAEGAVVVTTVEESRGAAAEDMDALCDDQDIGICRPTNDAQGRIRSTCSVEGCMSKRSNGRPYQTSAICMNPLCSKPEYPFFVCPVHEKQHETSKRKKNSKAYEGWKVETHAKKREASKMRRNQAGGGED
eukprot:FR738576.1.p1 GENE.FR738576.1~~FR738576.1.p1  ORF type:complete len:186 (+),score=18.26 FR738576.1:54-560(+)